MKSPKTTMAALAFGFAMLSTPPSQAAKYIMGAHDGDWRTAANTWHYQTTHGDPGDGSGCAASPDKWETQSDNMGGNTYYHGYYEIFTLGEPFSGSVSRTRYVTLCKNGAYITYRLTLSHSGCGLWICTTNWNSTMMRALSVPHQDKHTGTIESRFKVLLNPR